MSASCVAPFFWSRRNTIFVSNRPAHYFKKYDVAISSSCRGLGRGKQTNWNNYNTKVSLTLMGHLSGRVDGAQARDLKAVNEHLMAPKAIFRFVTGEALQRRASFFVDAFVSFCRTTTGSTEPNMEFPASSSRFEQLEQDGHPFILSVRPLPKERPGCSPPCSHPFEQLQ